MGSSFKSGNGGSPQFREAFSDIPGAKKGGIFGSGIDGEDFVTMLSRAAALAQGDYGGAAQMGQLIGRDKRQAAERENDFSDWQRKKEWELQHSQPDIPPIVRDAQAFANMTSEERANLQRLEDLRNPIIRQGNDGLPYAHPRGAQLPGGLNPDEWEVVPDPQGGPTQPASGGFPGNVPSGNPLVPPGRRNRGY